MLLLWKSFWNVNFVGAKSNKADYQIDVLPKINAMVYFNFRQNIDIEFCALHEPALLDEL